MSKLIEVLANIPWETIAALSALGLSSISLVQTSRFNKRQNDFSETADRLNALLLEKEQNEQKLVHKANVDVNLISKGRSDYELRVFNTGANATNIDLEIMEGKSLLSKNELVRKLPYPLLAQNQHFKFIICASLDSPRQLHVKVRWDDENASGNEIERWLDL